MTWRYISNAVLGFNILVKFVLSCVLLYIIYQKWLISAFHLFQRLFTTSQISIIPRILIKVHCNIHLSWYNQNLKVFNFHINFLGGTGDRGCWRGGGGNAEEWVEGGNAEEWDGSGHAKGRDGGGNVGVEILSENFQLRNSWRFQSYQGY